MRAVANLIPRVCVSRKAHTNRASRVPGTPSVPVYNGPLHETREGRDNLGAHGPDAAGNQAKPGAPAERVEASHLLLAALAA